VREPTASEPNILLSQAIIYLHTFIGTHAHCIFTVQVFTLFQMAISKDTKTKAEKAPKEKKTTETKPKEKKVTEKKIKTNALGQKRGQPTAAARLISSQFVKYGWHKPLSGEAKAIVTNVRSMADSMYMLQIKRDRQIDNRSLRNGIFWEHRQLSNQYIVSTPAVEQFDLFPSGEAEFPETLERMRKKVQGRHISMHCFFESLREREFLLLPIQIDDAWVTIIARFQPKGLSANEKPNGDGEIIRIYVDREVTDLAIVDPTTSDHLSRQSQITKQFALVLAEGCIELSEKATLHKFGLTEAQHKWETGLISYAISREFIRRLKTLLWRRRHSAHSEQDDLWADFEEEYNLDAYREGLMSACAHQCIEKSNYNVRLALEVPSEESDYKPELLSHAKDTEQLADEKWDMFEETHTYEVPLPEHIFTRGASSEPTRYPISPSYAPTTPNRSPTSPTVPRPTIKHEEEDTMKVETASNAEESEPIVRASSLEGTSSENELPDIGTSVSQNAPVAPMGEPDSLPRIADFDMINSTSQKALLNSPPRNNHLLFNFRGALLSWP
jgi:hypothetical protein